MKEINYIEYGRQAYHEWAICQGYTIPEETLLNASSKQLEEFKEGLIDERKIYTNESDKDHEEVFWAVMDEMGIATKLISHKCTILI